VARRKGLFNLSLALLLSFAGALGFIFWLALTIGYPPPDPQMRSRNGVIALVGLAAFLVGAGGAVGYAVAAFRAFRRRA
jgi:hypothetical protein